MGFTHNPGDRIDEEGFISYFMSHYKSAGVSKPDECLAYGSSYIITEFRNSYRVTIKGISKRFSSLYCTASHIYHKLFDRRCVYVAETSYRQIVTLEDTSPYLKRKYALELINCLKNRVNIMQSHQDRPLYAQ